MHGEDDGGGGGEKGWGRALRTRKVKMMMVV